MNPSEIAFIKYVREQGRFKDKSDEEIISLATSGELNQFWHPFCCGYLAAIDDVRKIMQDLKLKDRLND